MATQMGNDRGIGSAMRAVPDLVRMEQTRGLLKVVIKQLGLTRGIPIVFGAVSGSRLKMNDIVPCFFLSMWNTLGDREAVVSSSRRLNFNEFKDRVLRLSNGLQELGLEEKEKCAEVLYNGNEFLELFFACSFLGSPMPQLNWHLRPDELRIAINRAGPKVLVFDSEFTEKILSIKDELETVKEYVVIGGDGEVPEGMHSYEDLIESSQAIRPGSDFILALNPYTSGTTGAPKNVNYFDAVSYLFSSSVDAPSSSFSEFLKLAVMEFSFAYYFKGDRIRDEVSKNIRCLIPGPMYHAGVIVGWIPFIIFGGTVVPMRKFDAEEFLRLIEKERINWTFVAPTMLERVMALPSEVRGKYDLSSMRAIICAAAPCPPDLKRATNQFFKEQGCCEDVFHEYYGSAETMVTTALIPQDYLEEPSRIASVGRARCGVTKIYDDANEDWCPPNKEGRLLTRTLMTVALKYPGTPEKVRSSTMMVDGLPWFDDGLLGRMDEDGFIYLTGREKELIISGGVNIFPNEIEEVLVRNPKISDVGVIRVPHKDLGEVPAAIIQLKEGVISSPDEIKEFCKGEGLYGFKIPGIIEFVSELPRHVDGKLMKRELEERYWEGIDRIG